MNQATLPRPHVVELAAAAAFLAHQLREFARDAVGGEAQDYAHRAALLQSLAGDLTRSESVTLSGGLLHA